MTATLLVREADFRRGTFLLRIAGLTFYLLAAQALLTAGVGLEVYFTGGAPPDLLLPTVSVFLAVSYTVVGFFLRRRQVWARNFAVAFAVVSLFAFPVGTALGAFVVLCIDRANRAGVFLPGPVRILPTLPAAAEDEAPLLSFEPELASEHAG